jgi:hypothetical protein
MSAKLFVFMALVAVAFAQVGVWGESGSAAAPPRREKTAVRQWLPLRCAARAPPRPHPFLPPPPPPSPARGPQLNS